MEDRPNATERERLLTAINNCKQRLSDLTRELDESMRAEEDEATVVELQRVRDKVIELQHTLADLDAQK